MQRRINMQASSLIILFSIITIIVQFAVYYFIAAFYVIWAVSILISILCCLLLLNQTASYAACYNYSILTIFISTIIIIMSYFGKDQTFLPFTNAMLGVAFINWLIPCIVCFLWNMFDYGARIEDYKDFYRNDTALFLIVYLAVMLYGSFAASAFTFAYQGSLDAANFVPFEAIIIQIEDYLYGVIPLGAIITYLLCRILLFIPYGFQITLILRRNGRLPRFLALLILPFLLEAFQFFIIPYRCDIDDIIYALIGGIIGSLLYYLCNRIFRTVSGKNFLANEHDYRYSNNGLHF